MTRPSDAAAPAGDAVLHGEISVREAVDGRRLPAECHRAETAAEQAPETLLELLLKTIRAEVISAEELIFHEGFPCLRPEPGEAIRS